MADDGPHAVRVGRRRAGAAPADRGLLRAVRADPILAPVFAQMSEDHPQHVATWLGEVFGGPPRYTEEHGGYPHMLAKHRDRALTEEQRTPLGRSSSARRPTRPGCPTTPSSAPRSSPTSSGGRGSRWPTRSRARTPPPEAPVPRWGWGEAPPYVAVASARRWRSASSPARAPTRCPGSRAASRSRSPPRWGETLVSRGTFGGVDVAHVSRHGAGHVRLSNHVDAPGEHRRARAARRRRRARGHGLRRGRPGRRARLADLLRRPALPGQPAAGRLALHVLRRAGRSAPRALDLRGPVRGPAARARCSTRRRRRGHRDARRRLLRPRRRAALQHAGGDPRARRGRRHGRLPDRRARRPCWPARPSCRSRSSATRPTTPTACRPRRRRSSGCSS